MKLEIFDIDIKRQELAKLSRLEELEKTYSGIYPEIEISTPKKWDELSDMEFIPEIRIRRLERVANLVRPFSKILDIGVGWGDIIPILERKYQRVDYAGIDFSSEIVKKITQKYPGYKFLNIAVDQLNEKYDVVLMLEVLEHMPPSKVLTFLRQTRRVLNKSGILILTVPINEDLKNNTFICSNCGQITNKMGHVRMYSPELIIAELKLTGFSVVYSELLYFGYYGFSGVIKRNIRNILGRLKGPFTFKKVEPGCIILKCKLCNISI